MQLQELKVNDKFKFSSKQEVKTSTYKGGEVTLAQVLGRGTTGTVIRMNTASVRVKLDYRDKDRKDQECTLRFRNNPNVEVEKI